MKLTACHVENFGKLHNLDLYPAAGLNIFCHENGWGKSTFAAFLKAMFYGLEGDRKRDITENERKRYRPWQGGAFGGSISFEAEGKTYTVTRIFGDKESADLFELRDGVTNLPSGDYSEHLGEELFGVDRESFLKTVFISQNSLETGATDDIHSRIGSMAEETHDMEHYEDAMDALTDLINYLTPSRKSGMISRRLSEITVLEKRVMDGQGIQAELERLHGDYQQTRGKLDSLRSDRKQLQEEEKKLLSLQKTAAEREELNGLLKRLQECRGEQEEIRRQFPGSVPAQEDVEEWLRLCEEQKKAETRASMGELNAQEKLELVKYRELLGEHRPEDAELEELIGLNDKYLACREQVRADGYEKAGKAKRLQELEGLFASETENPGEILACWKEAEGLALQVKEMEEESQDWLKNSIRKSHIQGHRGVLCLICAAVAVLMAALAGMLFSWLIPASVLLCMAGILAVGGLVWTGKSRKTRKEAYVIRENQEGLIREDEDHLSLLQEKVYQYLENHGFPETGEDRVGHCLYTLGEWYQEYLYLDRNREELLSGPLEEEMRTHGDRIQSFLAQYGLGNEEMRYGEELIRLQQMAGGCRTLSEKEQQYHRERDRAERLAVKLESAFATYGWVQASDFQELALKIRDQLNCYENARIRTEKMTAELAAFRSSHNMEELTRLEEMQKAGELPDLEQLHQKMQELEAGAEGLQEEMRVLQNSMEELQEQQELWEGDVQKLAEEREALETERQKYEDVSLARQYLEQAHHAITTKYTGPVLQAFGEYYEMITGQGAQDFAMDATITLTRQEQGKQRELECLSTGYRDLTGFCLRIAFVDAMYDEERPVLILDDPFVSLDDEKKKQADRLLEKLAEKYQILCFTCSEVRALAYWGNR